MSHDTSHKTTVSASVGFNDKKGLTVADVRVFLDDCDAVDMPPGTPVRVKQNLSSEGARWTGDISASFSFPTAAEYRLVDLRQEAEK